MKKSRLAAHVAALLCATPALADEATRWTPLETIIVTAQRENAYAASEATVLRSGISILQTPQSVQVLTRGLLDDQELNTLDEALANVAGVIPSQSSEILLTNPVIRGFEGEIFTDGLIGYGDTAVSDPASLWHVERVEVAKGPTSTLFGGGIGAPVGGLINLVTKTAGFEPSASVRLRAGSFDTVAVAADGNLPLSDKVAVRLLGEIQDANDYIDTVEVSRALAAPSIRLRPAEGTDIVARLNYSRVRQTEYVGLPASMKGLAIIERDRFTSATDAPKAEIENLSASLDVTQKLSDGVSANLRIRRYENQFDEYSSSPFLSFFPCVGTACYQFNGYLTSRVREWTVDGSVSAEFATGGLNHAMLIGAQWDRTNYFGALGVDLFFPGLIDLADPASDMTYVEPALAPASVNHYRTLALYAQDQVTVADRFHLLVSLRYSTLKINEVSGGAGNNETYHELDPRIGATFDLVKGVSLFAGYATGSRLSLFFNGTNSPVPERSESIEAGLKFGLADAGLSGTLAAFQLTRTNVPTPDPLTFFTSIQTGKQRSKGVELDLIYEPSKAFSLLGSYARTNAKVVEDTLIPAGERLARVPRNRGRIAARYRLLDGAAKGLEFGAGMTASSKATMSLPNGLNSDGYVIFDAQASYQLGAVRLGLRIDNLFNRKYFAPYSYYAQDVVRPGNPRSAYVSVGATF